MSEQACEVLEFPHRPDAYCTGWRDGFAYGEKWASVRLFCLGLFLGVMATFALAVTYWAVR